jgi:hypothetical protein
MDKKQELLKIIQELVSAAESYGGDKAIDDTATHYTGITHSGLKTAKKEIKILMDEVRKRIEEL